MLAEQLLGLSHKMFFNVWSPSCTRVPKRGDASGYVGGEREIAAQDFADEGYSVSVVTLRYCGSSDIAIRR